MDLKEKYVWFDIDYKKFALIAIYPQDKQNAVIILRNRDKENEPYPWCVEYKGGGHYFKTADEMFAYCDYRGWKLEL